jgi:hypothetical protein
MLTTITVNGAEGLQFLASLQEERARPVPPALVAMIEHVTTATFGPHDIENVRLECTPTAANEIAAFVESLGVHAGRTGWPLLFSAEIGDLVVIVRDALAEMDGPKRSSPGRIWRFVAGGTRARLVARRGDIGKLLLLDGKHEREHVYLSDRCTTRSRSKAFP